MKTNLSKIKWFVVFTLIVLTSIASAQDTSKPAKDLYLSYFGNDSTNLNIVYAPCGWNDYYALITGVIYNRDTVRIDENLYYYRAPQSLNLFMTPAPHYLFPRYDTLFLREERETGRLYRYYRDYFGMGETEKLVCDMSLEVGDKFVVTNDFDSCLLEDTLTVYSVDYNNNVKTIVLTGYMEERIFKEGIFPLSFPLWQEPVEYGLTTSLADLLCVHKDGIKVYGGSNDCFPNLWGVEEHHAANLTIYPNPTTGIINVSGDNIAAIEVVNIMGQTMLNKDCDGSEANVDISSLVPGIYLIKARTSSGTEFSERVVKE